MLPPSLTPPSDTYYSFTESTIGEFTLKNNLTNQNLYYTLIREDGCGGSAIVVQGKLDPKPLTLVVGPLNSSLKVIITFSGLPDGSYILKLKHGTQPFYTPINILHYGRLEQSIIEGAKEIFGTCKDCSTPTNLCCLIGKINYYFTLKNLNVKDTLFDKYKCTMLSKVDCTLDNDFFYGECKSDLKFIISLYYLSMYRDRILVNKKEIYDYDRIHKYISANIINLS